MISDHDELYLVNSPIQNRIREGRKVDLDLDYLVTLLLISDSSLAEPSCYAERVFRMIAEEASRSRQITMM